MLMLITLLKSPKTKKILQKKIKKYGITSSPIEEPLSEFTTKIYSTDSARQNNINITCNTLNGTVVNNGETFSFCNTVGKATTDKGYQEADIYDHDGKKEKGLGGGNLSLTHI